MCDKLAGFPFNLQDFPIIPLGCEFGNVTCRSGGNCGKKPFPRSFRELDGSLPLSPLPYFFAIIVIPGQGNMWRVNA